MPTEDEPDLTATFGLHRGRRVLLGCVVGVLLAAGGYALSRPASVEAAAPPVVTVVGEPEPDLAPLPPKRRAKPVVAKSARRARALSAPPLLAAAVPVVKEETLEEAAAIEAAAPTEPAAPPEPSIEDGNGEHIARAIAEQKRAAVQTCFERELKQTPTLQGTLVVELDLSAPHRVNEVRVSDDLDRPSFTQCVSSSMDQFTFAALNEDVSIRVPYVLSAREK